MNDYYIISPETGPVFPQVQKMSPGYNYNDTNSVYILSRSIEDFPGTTPNLNHFVLQPKAKPTDLLSTTVAYGGFLISNKLKIILEKYHLPKHKFYPAQVLHKKELYNYYWLHVICNLTNQVDYEKSLFYISHNYGHRIEYIKILSKKDLLNKKEKLKQDNPGKTVSIWAEKIKMVTDFDTSLDLFKVGTFDTNFYISTLLTENILSDNLTGISLKKATDILID